VTRSAVARALVVLAALLLVATTLTAYAWRAVFDSEQFADRATAALQSSSVRQAVADRVTDELVLERQPDLLAARPIIAAAVTQVVGGNAFAALFRRAVDDVHRAVFRADDDTVTLTLTDVGIVAADALEQLEPRLAARLRSRERVAVLSRHLGSLTGDLARLADRVRWLAYLSGALTLLVAAAALAVGGDRRRTATRLGLAFVVAGVAVVAAEVVARAIALDGVDGPDDRAAAGAVWDAFLGDLRSVGWLIAATGAVVTAAATSLIRPVEVEEPLRDAWRTVATEPRSTLLRAARGTVLVLAGLLVILEPTAVLRMAVILGGIYVLYKGMEALLRLLSPVGERAANRPRMTRLGIAAVAALLISAGVVAFIERGAFTETAAAVATCNGHAELCDRPLDQVALPATHNSMSVPLPGWFAPLQERPIREQLEDGIRGLLFDTHYADLLANGRTRTYFGGPAGLRRAINQDGVSEQSVEAAKRLRGRLGFRGEGERGMYLCHTFCELGATPLPSVLEDIHEFLVTHPGEVVVVINQDFVTPDDFVDAMEDAGLTRYAIEPPTGARWPTLRELIERDQRLLVLAENRAGAAPWYQLAYERITQETPFSFAEPAQLVDPPDLPSSCRANRGTSGAPLFLVNHWINTDPAPRPSNAAVVNGYEPILRRARVCQDLRGQRPNLLAVDFYEEGDIFDVVDTLNGVRHLP
jgi:uncharacterized membrane protein HdeD (DUF308 family)